MEKRKIAGMRMGLFATIAAYAVVSMLAWSCIKDADDDPAPQPPQPEPAVVTDTTTVVADSAFLATRQYLIGTWQSEYLGFDTLQSASFDKKVVSRIRRFVYFAEDGTYDSHVQGIVDIDTTTNFMELEHEHGTFDFNEARQLMTYRVEYDSVVNFKSEQLQFFPGKMIQGKGVFQQYDERLLFSVEKDGQREWIRLDDNLRALDNHEAQLVYTMKNR